MVVIVLPRSSGPCLRVRLSSNVGPQIQRMFEFLHRETRKGGLISHLGLDEWWEKELALQERNAILSRYQPMEGEGTSLTPGEVLYTSQSPLHFLWGLATRFKQPEDLPIAQKIFAKGSSLVANSPALDVHFFHQSRIEFFYRLRDFHPQAKAIAEQACRDQIAIAPQVAAAFSAQHDDGLPSHKGFWQLAVLLEKDGRLMEAAEVCESARAAGWPGDWEARRDKLLKKLAKAPAMK